MGKTASLANIGTIADSSLGFRNRLINGGMTIDQRNAGASVTPTTSAYVVDRWLYATTQSSKFTLQQNAGSVTPPVGFTNYLGATSTSAYSIVSSDVFALYHRIEGLNCADLAWGTASAATVNLSFWVRSSLTGTFGGSFRNSSNNRSYPFSYTISASNTWEQKTITIAGDTTGTWSTNTETGIQVCFGLGVGSTFSGTAGSWSASSLLSATGATSVVGTNGATFYITGVQLEKGSTATSFDYRPYTTELQLCQRYYERSAADTLFSGNVTSAGDYFYFVTYKVTKRAVATVTPTNSLALSFPATASTVNQNNVDGFQLYRSANATARGYFFDAWTASAEL
jgi:hypothetical protein